MMISAERWTMCIRSILFHSLNIKIIRSRSRSRSCSSKVFFLKNLLSWQSYFFFTNIGLCTVLWTSKAGHTLHKPITQVTCLKPYCTITVSSLVQVPPTHYAIFFLNWLEETMAPTRKQRLILCTLYIQLKSKQRLALLSISLTKTISTYALSFTILLLYSLDLIRHKHS